MDDLLGFTMWQIRVLPQCFSTSHVNVAGHYHRTLLHMEREGGRVEVTESVWISLVTTRDDEDGSHDCWINLLLYDFAKDKSGQRWKTQCNSSQRVYLTYLKTNQKKEPWSWDIPSPSQLILRSESARYIPFHITGKVNSWGKLVCERGKNMCQKFFNITSNNIFFNGS